MLQKLREISTPPQALDSSDGAGQPHTSRVLLRLEFFMVMDDEQRLDDLLAKAEAHTAILVALAAKAFSNNQERGAVRDMACGVFEHLYSAIEMTDRSHRFAQKALAEIERVFRAPSGSPQADETGTG